MGEVVAGPGAPGNVVCDLDGVVYLDREPIPGSGRALAQLALSGYRILFVTNNSTTPPAGVAYRIHELTGYEARPEQVLTSALAAAGLISDERRPVFVIGGEGITAALRDVGVESTDRWREAGAVLVGLDRQLSYERLRDASLAVRAGARFVATNDDPTFPAPSGLWPGAGAITAALEVSTGRRPEVAGKPHRPMRELVRARLAPGATWMVGDRPSSDLAMAKAEGWHSVLVLSGVENDPDRLPDDLRPDIILERLEALPAALSERRT